MNRRITSISIMITAAMFFSILTVSATMAHGGRTDANGGHNCNVGACAGTYHYHNGGGTPPPAPTPAPMPAPDPAPVPEPAPPPAPPKPKPKAIQQLRTLRNDVSKSSVLWVDLILQAVKDTKTTSSYSTVDPAAEAAKRLTQSTQANKNVAGNTLYYVKSITDGDTIKIVKDGATQTVRLLGIDTPETKDPRKPVQCFGKEATQHITRIALGKYVRLETDPSQGDKDRYQRLLRYVYLENGTNVNALMVRDGFAVAYVRYPVSQMEEYIKLQESARKASAGLWSACR